MTVEVALILLLGAFILFVGSLSPAVHITDKPTVSDWLCGIFVIVFLCFPWVGRALLAPSEKPTADEFAIFCSLFYVFAGAAIGYESGVEAERRRSTNFPIA